MPASRRRWWWSGSWPRKAISAGAISVARNSSSASGGGRNDRGGQIANQLKRLGASCDWSRERFTLDAGLNDAVTKVFVQLYNEGLLYRDKRLVNWDPQFQTAISDLEVETGK